MRLWEEIEWKIGKLEKQISQYTFAAEEGNVEREKSIISMQRITVGKGHTPLE